MLTPERKIRLLLAGTIASLVVNVACAHAFAMAMTVTTAGHYSDDTKILLAGILTIGVSVSLVGFFVCSYLLLSRIR